MRWPLAISFSQPDLKLAEATSELVKRANVGVYCYTDRIIEQIGQPLYLLHQKVFAEANFIAYFLRPDFLERPYTELEYRLGLGRTNAEERSAFFLADDECEFLVPRQARHVFRLKQLTRAKIGLENKCAEVILAALRATSA